MAAPPISYTALPNSTSLDLTSYRGNGTLPASHLLLDSFSFNVALVLERANDPTALLSADWASRQQQLAALDQNGTLWSTFGADPAKYHEARTKLADMGFSLFPEGANQQYVSSAELRTIWLHVDETNITKLFGIDALHSGLDDSGNSVTFWQGNLSLPDSLISAGVKGVMFDTPMFAEVLAKPGGGALAALPQGPQSAGNAVPDAEGIFPNDLAATYDFPFNSASTPDWWKTVQTGPIGLLEPNLGTALPSGSASFRHLADTYRRLVGIDAHGHYIDVAPGGAHGTTSGERSLDVGIVTTANPTSPIILYAGSGINSDAHSSVYTAYQAAFWDDANKPRVVSSSYRDYPHIAPHSPFYFAYKELFVDAALRNITVVNAVGDDGSGDQFANGLTNVDVSHASPYSIVAGGTSLSTLEAATRDATLQNIAAAATAGDPATIWQLVAGGLTALPSSVSSSAADSTITKLIETVWNGYFVFEHRIVDKNDNGGGYNNNYTSAGGVDPSQPQPSYQTDFGLNLATADPDALPGRGVPDVSALAGGNSFYNIPTSDMTGVGFGAGTSAAAPMWAALVAQFDEIFHDQGLPHLGYMNDLLYIAAAVAPAAFNDVTLGSNTSSFTLGGPYRTPPENGADPTQAVTPTGFGYSADPGYDLTSGLGTPNGILLGRALTAIAHQQMSFATSPDVVDVHGTGGLTTPVAQTLLIQATSGNAMTASVLTGSDSLSFTSAPSASFAWTSLLAQQSLQPDFDPNLVRMFDVQSQGVLAQSLAQHGDRLAVLINGTSAQTPQVTLSSPFGFVDFVSGTGDSAVRVARSIAVAETVGGLDDQHAVVRIRQNGQDSLTLKLYRVDDFNGTINGLHPGDPGYQAAVQVRAYQTTTGATSIDGPGFGNFVQTELRHVNAGDLVAMQLTNETTGNTYSAFRQANEIVNGQPIGHLWNYGLNTWGWEDTPGGGDRDYNDLVVGIDFTSAFGNGWLV